MLDTRITAVAVLPMVHVFSTQTVAESYAAQNLIWTRVNLVIKWVIYFFIATVAVIS